MTGIKRKCFQKIKEEPQWQREQILRSLHRQRGCLDLSANHYLGESLQDDVYRWWIPLPILELHVFNFPDDRCCMVGQEGR